MTATQPREAPAPMTDSIAIPHQPHDGSAPETVDLAYRIDTDGAVRVIACAVNPASRNAHRWLAVQKFDVRMRLARGKYTLLHTAKNDSVNRDTAEFIDHVWAAIMQREGWVAAE